MIKYTFENKRDFFVVTNIGTIIKRKKLYKHTKICCNTVMTR